MSNSKTYPPGWYPSPNKSGSGEYWNGNQWTGRLRASLNIELDQVAPPRTPPAQVGLPATRSKWGIATWAGVVITGIWFIAALASNGISGVLIAAGTVSLFTAIFVIISGRRSWLHIPSRKAGALLLAGGIIVLGASGATGAIAPIQSQTEMIQLVDQGTVSTPTPTATTKKPTTVTKEEGVVEDLAFAETQIDDPNLAAGTTTVTTPGVAGQRTITYVVTYVDGVETKRTVKSDVTTVAPVTQVTSNGTYVEPPPPAPAPLADSGGCDSNYSGPCVPIASDVDCAGGNGNGPAYVQGPVYVVGSDIYELDRDGDGIACD